MDTAETTVVGASLLSFLPGIGLAEREAVQLAVLMAQRVTQGDYREGLVQDWYSHYRRQLQFYGWDAATPEQVHWPDPGRQMLVERALEAVRQVAGERHVSILRAALEALAGSPDGLRQLERRSREMGLFQLLPCAPRGDGWVDMVLYHEAGEQASFSFDFLSGTLQTSLVRAELVRFNARAFQRTHAARVRQTLARVMHQEIVAVAFDAAGSQIAR